MIKSLHIKNYALIKDLSISPSPKLNVITGETGAGKSIMLGAVGLLLGNRVDTRVLLDENQKCTVEGLFDIRDYRLKSLFDEEGLDYAGECIIRREISAAGKSRAFINDTPVTLNVLKNIGEHLMDVHSQHGSLNLGNNDYQLQVIDTFSAHDELLKNYSISFENYRRARKKHEKLIEQSRKGNEDAEYKQYLMEELEAADLDGLSQEKLQNELETLENAEEIKLKLSQSIHLLDESEVAIIQQLKEVSQALGFVRSFSKDIDDLANRIESISIELQDILSEIQNSQDRIEYDPERIQSLKDRLDLIYRLQKKHALQTIGQLVERRDELSTGLSQIADLDDDIKHAKTQLDQTGKEMFATGKKLSESRKLYGINLADEIEKIIKKIGIENGTIEILVNETEPNKYGLDKVDMLFSANKGVKPQELKEVASGGEFSRLIFAIKYLIADKTALPTVIFDEIDTGVSGQIALQMIRMMKRMAENHQVINISHLPQFAAGGDAHYYVYKDHTSGRSVSKMKRMENEDRILEIAKMIGGENPAASAVESAKELLQIG